MLRYSPAGFGFRFDRESHQELERARTGIIRDLPEEFETLDSAAGTVAGTWAKGLPVSDLAAFPTRLAAVTLDEVNAVSRKYAQPEKAFFVLVGDREKIEPQVREFR